MNLLRLFSLLALLGFAACSSSNVGAVGPSPNPLPPPPPGNTDAVPDRSSNVDNSVIGTWNYQMTGTPVGTVSGVITIEQAGNGLGGTMTEDYTNQTIPLENIQVDGNKLSMAAVFTIEGQAIDMYLSGTIEGNRFTGNADVAGMGNFPMTATRQ